MTKLHSIKYLRLHNVDIFEQVLKEKTLRKIYCRNFFFEILVLPLITSEVILSLMKNLRLRNVSICRFFFLSKSVHK